MPGRGPQIAGMLAGVGGYAVEYMGYVLALGAVRSGCAGWEFRRAIVQQAITEPLGEAWWLVGGCWSARHCA